MGNKKIESRSKASEGERKLKDALVRLQTERAALEANNEIADEMMSESSLDQ